MQNNSTYRRKDSPDSRKSIQTDMEFLQTKIDDLNHLYGVTMFQSKTSQGHVFAAEQKIRELKKGIYTYLQRSKSNENLQTKNHYKILGRVKT